MTLILILMAWRDYLTPMDLFDWLDIVKRLRSDGFTQEQIGQKIGWIREKVAYYQAILEKVVTDVLEICKGHQSGRVTDNVTHVTFNFTEGSFHGGA